MYFIRVIMLYKFIIRIIRKNKFDNENKHNLIINNPKNPNLITVYVLL